MSLIIQSAMNVYKMAVAEIPLCAKAFKEAVSNVCAMLGLTKLYPEQENALFHFLSRENVFVNLPTSYGKSMIFQIAPLVASELSKSCTQFEVDCIIIVISPLIALMNDQVASLQKCNIAAASVFSEQDAEVLNDVENGKFSIVYASPESMLSVSRWRRMLSNETYKKRLIGIAVDEAHCISHWYVAVVLLYNRSVQDKSKSQPK